MFPPTAIPLTLVALLASASALGIDRSRLVTPRQPISQEVGPITDLGIYLSSAAQSLIQFSATLDQQSLSSNSTPDAPDPLKDLTTAGTELAQWVESAQEVDVESPTNSVAPLEDPTRAIAILFANLTYVSPVPLAPALDLSGIKNLLMQMAPAAMDLATLAASLVGPAAKQASLQPNLAVGNRTLLDSITDLANAAAQAQTKAYELNTTAATPADLLPLLTNITTTAANLDGFFNMPLDRTATVGPLPLTSVAPDDPTPTSTVVAVPTSTISLPSGGMATPTRSAVYVTPYASGSGILLADSPGAGVAYAAVNVASWAARLAGAAVALAGDQVALAAAFKPNGTEGLGNIKAPILP